MLTPNAELAEIPERKVTHYFLSLASEEGHGKAAFFLSKGFVPTRWVVLAAALREHACAHPYAGQSLTQWCTKYVVDGPLQGPDGTTVNIRSDWNIRSPAIHPRLVTAHPLPRPSDQRR